MYIVHWLERCPTNNKSVKGTLQRKSNTENSKQVFTEKELRGQSPNFHLYVSVSDLYIPTIDLPILLHQSWEYIKRSQTVEIRTKTAQFPEKEYINKITGAV
jgi:hypothetical protein